MTGAARFINHAFRASFITSIVFGLKFKSLFFSGKNSYIPSRLLIRCVLPNRTPQGAPLAKRCKHRQLQRREQIKPCRCYRYCLAICQASFFFNFHSLVDQPFLAGKSIPETSPDRNVSHTRLFVRSSIFPPYKNRRRTIQQCLMKINPTVSAFFPAAISSVPRVKEPSQNIWSRE